MNQRAVFGRKHEEIPFFIHLYLGFENETSYKNADFFPSVNLLPPSDAVRKQKKKLF